MIVWWSIGAGVHVEPHSHANEQIVWMLKGKMEFRLGSEQRVCSGGDVVVIPGGTEHEAWFREDTEVIDFFAPPRAEFLHGGKPRVLHGRDPDRPSRFLAKITHGSKFRVDLFKARANVLEQAFARLRGCDAACDSC
jgi:hypothetical protein